LKGVIGDGPRKKKDSNNKFDLIFQVFENKSMEVMT
jgi:hypothetical protein